jgi:hypothetical protein
MAQERPKPSPVPSKVGGGRLPEESTGINPDQRGPIDPRMPNAPPA